MNSFQSTLPVWGATDTISIDMLCGVFQSTLPVWGATPRAMLANLIVFRFQSTLPVWGATQEVVFVNGDTMISIHAPRVGSDQTVSDLYTDLWDFNPRSPCGERRPHLTQSTRRTGISIHAPRVGSDFLLFVFKFHLTKFQSTLPVWGATSHFLTLF